MFKIEHFYNLRMPYIIDRVSELREDSIKAIPGYLVHKDCRRNYVNPNASVNSKEAGSTTPTAPRTLPSTTPDFSFKDNCLYCGQHNWKLMVKKEAMTFIQSRRSHLKQD